MAGGILVRGGNWIAERENVECQQLRTGPPFKTSEPCWDVGARVKTGRTYQVRLTVGEPWRDLDISTTPGGFGVPEMSLAGNIFTPLRRSLFSKWFTPMVKIVPPRGGFTLVPLEMKPAEANPAEYVGEFKAPRGGPVYMFVNDVILPPWVPKHRYFYDNNKGTVVKIEFKETADR
jgi:hypothetical protein